MKRLSAPQLFPTELRGPWRDIVITSPLFRPPLSRGAFLCCRVLLQCGVDVNGRDIDGWTPLHAAAHWGQEEVCGLLADNMCDMGAVNNVVSSRKGSGAGWGRLPSCPDGAL